MYAAVFILAVMVGVLAAKGMSSIKPDDVNRHERSTPETRERK